MIITKDNTKPMYTEIFNHIGSGVANHKIDRANLEVNQEYSLRVVVNVNGLKLENFQTFGKCSIFVIYVVTNL